MDSVAPSDRRSPPGAYQEPFFLARFKTWGQTGGTPISETKQTRERPLCPRISVWRDRRHLSFRRRVVGGPSFAFFARGGHSRLWATWDFDLVLASIQRHYGLAV